MSIIINDFEVVVEPPEQPGERDAETQQTRSGEFKLSPLDVRAVMAREAIRQARVRAH